MQPTPFNDPLIRDWVGDAVGLPRHFPDDVGTIGSGPFDEDDFDDFLERLGVEVSVPVPEQEVVVVGRTDWTEEQLSNLVTNRVGATLRVYSQEMLLAWIISADDPFHKETEFLIRLAGGHPALEFLMHFGFEWPSTEVYGGGGTQPDGEWPRVGLLSHMGYRVGRTAGRPEALRHAILKIIFESDSLPRVNDVAYMREWGPARSRTRLLKLANTLASLCQNEKRRSRPPWMAIEQREADLAWAKREFYDGKFDFEWPSTDIWY